MSEENGARKSRTNRKHTGEFKLAVIEDIRDNGLGYREAEAKYHVEHSVIRKWERIFLEQGPDSLFIDRRGRSPKVDSPVKGRPVKLDKQVEEDLIAEVQRLRMENAYLKKLNALVQEKERSNQKTKLR